MNCTGCGQPIELTNSVTTPHGRAARGECKPCDRQFTFVTLLVYEAEKGMDRGHGMRAVAKLLDRARVVFGESED
jgi:hypothetical protein